jgi:hypothetical protein
MALARTGEDAILENHAVVADAASHSSMAENRYHRTAFR